MKATKTSEIDMVAVFVGPEEYFFLFCFFNDIVGFNCIQIDFNEVYCFSCRLLESL